MSISMSFQDCLIKRISNKSDFHIHVLNQLPCVRITYTMGSQFGLEHRKDYQIHAQLEEE